MNPGTDVQEVITGRAGVVVEIGIRQVLGDGTVPVFFPSLKGNLNLDGTYDSGVRNILDECLKPVPKEALVAQLMEIVANVLQAEEPGIYAVSRF